MPRKLLILLGVCIFSGTRDLPIHFGEACAPNPYNISVESSSGPPTCRIALVTRTTAYLYDNGICLLYPLPHLVCESYGLCSYAEDDTPIYGFNVVYPSPGDIIMFTFDAP